jgi:dTDP-4-amino-4,6-dideoxygalactose transaminase
MSGPGVQVRVPFLDLRAGYAELAPEFDAAYRRVMEAGWFILGPEVEAFEREFAAYCGARHGIGLGNGLDALHLALRVLEIGAGDEVMVPSNTYIATWLAISNVGATPVPVEPILATANIDPDLIEAAITPRTRALLVVDLYGQPAEMTRINAIAKRHGLPVVEDAAQSHGATVDGRRVGALADLTAWSFYPTKNLGAFGDAGAITIDDAKVADRVRLLRNYGSRVKYYNEEKGLNSRLDPLQAALLRVKLARLDEWNARRRRLAETYLDRFRGLDRLALPETAPGVTHAWHVFTVRCEDRDGLQAALAERGVGTLIHYPVPPHLSDAYADSGYRRGAFPLAEKIADTILSLPIGPHLSDADQARVIEGVVAWAQS